MKEVTQSDGAYAFAREVCREAGRRATEDPDDRIKFLSTVLQVRPRNGKIRATRGKRPAEQNAVFRVEEFMLIALRTRHTDHCTSSRDSRHRCVGQWTLREKGGTADGNREDDNDNQIGPMKCHRATATESGSDQEGAIRSPWSSL